MEIRDQLYIKRTSYAHYQRLAWYHYIRQDIAIYKYIYGIYPRLPWLKQYPHPVAVTVYAPPLPNIRPRRKALDGILDIPRDRRESLSVINTHILYASRIIVDPRYEHLGLATWLARITYKLVPYRIIEVLTPVDDTTSWLTGLGFKTYLIPCPDYYQRVIKALCRAGITRALFNFPDFANRRIEKLCSKSRNVVLYELQRFVNHFKSHMNQPHSVTRTDYIFQKLHYPNAYHVLVKNSLSSESVQIPRVTSTPPEPGFDRRRETPFLIPKTNVPQMDPFPRGTSLHTSPVHRGT